MKLFQYAIIRHPTAEQKKKGERSTVVVDVQTVLAKDKDSATILAARAIPEEYVGEIDQLEIALRPF